MELLQLLGAAVLFLLVVLAAILGEYGWGIDKISGGYAVRFGCGAMSFTKPSSGASHSDAEKDLRAEEKKDARHE